MKILTNKNYNSILSYFPGVDYPSGDSNSWSLDNPAVYFYVKDNIENKVELPKFTMKSQAKYLLFKTYGKVEYQVFISSRNVFCNGNLKAYFYDYLDFLKVDVQKSQNYLYQFDIPPIIESSDEIKQFYDFSFDFPTYILMKIVCNNQESLNKNFTLNFNHPFLQFNYEAHWIRDWGKKVEGKAWNTNGKLNSSNSLFYLYDNIGREYPEINRE